MLAAPDTFTAAHLDRCRGAVPAPLAELAAACLEVVARLGTTGLEFVFKGGNSQLLILPQPHRFSIDADVATGAAREEVTAAVERVVALGHPFHRWVHRPHKTKPWIPMTSYEIYYRSVAGAEAFMMLDAILRPCPFPVQRRAVACGELYRSAVEVTVPTVEGLLSDKFFCLGPRTLGIPLGKKKEGQRLKHLFDTARLSELRPDPAVLRGALDRVLAQELELQQREMPFAEVVRDTREFLALIAATPAEPAGPTGDALLDEVVVGRPQLAKHLFAQEYPWESLRRDAAIAARLVDAVAGA